MSKKQGEVATGKKRGPYEIKGNKCAVPGHNHAPNKCRGSGKTRCEICKKPLSGHKTMEFCNEGAPATVHVLNRTGRRVKK